MASKTKKQSVSETNEQLLLKSEALKKIHEHNRDFLTVSLTLPLGNTALKNVHTNQWLFTELPKEFDLANWTVIADALNSTENRSERYVANRWYIEGVDISVDAGGKAEMKLSCNAFASSYEDYTEANKSMMEAYTQATSTTTTTTTSTKTTTSKKNNSNAVKKSGTGNSTIKNGWWGKWVTEFVKKTVGNETDTLKKCKKVYETFRQHVYYKYYYNAPKTYKGVSTYEAAYKNGHLNCGDGANILCAFYECCGASSTIYLGPNHFVVKCTIKGKSYFTDQSGGEGMHNTRRGWNQTWNNIRGGSNQGKRIKYP